MTEWKTETARLCKRVREQRALRAVAATQSAVERATLMQPWSDHDERRIDLIWARREAEQVRRNRERLAAWRNRWYTQAPRPPKRFHD